MQVWFFKAIAILRNQNVLLQQYLHIVRQTGYFIIGTGPLGTGKMGYPGAVRNTGAHIPHGLSVEGLLPPTEKNGFTILKVTPEKTEVKIFTWRKPQKISDIPAMKPAFTFSILSTTDRRH